VFLRAFFIILGDDWNAHSFDRDDFEGARRQSIGPALSKQHSSSSDKNTISPADTFTDNFTRSAVDDVKKWWCSQIELNSSDDDDYDYEFVK
jgi:hypothetical protein